MGDETVKRATLTPRQTEVLQLIREGKVSITTRTFGWRTIHNYFDPAGVNVSSVVRILFKLRKITYVSNAHNIVKGFKVVESKS